MYGLESERKASSLNGLRLPRATGKDGGPAPRTVQRALKSMPVRVPPEDLGVRLRVMASREASWRRLSRAERISAIFEPLRQWCSDLMRPIALPTAGGLVSALLLFGLLAPPLAFRGVSAPGDVPTGLYTGASIKSMLPLAFDGDEALVELTVNQEGRMVDYYLLDDADRTVSPEVRRNLENYLLTMVFTPATSFGVPKSAKLRIWLRNSRIDVRG